jgi:hypothetical protein
VVEDAGHVGRGAEAAVAGCRSRLGAFEDGDGVACALEGKCGGNPGEATADNEHAQ